MFNEKKKKWIKDTASGGKTEEKKSNEPSAPKDKKMRNQMYGSKY